MGKENKKNNIQTRVADTLINLVHDIGQDSSINSVGEKNLSKLSGKNLLSTDNRKIKIREEISLPFIDTSGDIENQWQEIANMTISKNIDNLLDSTLIKDIKKNDKSKKSSLDNPKKNINSFDSDDRNNLSNAETIIAINSELNSQTSVETVLAAGHSKKESKNLNSIVEMITSPNKINSNEANKEQNRDFKINIIDDKIFKSEQLQIAQQKIEQLENQVEYMRLDNEKLGAASQLLQKKNEELVETKNKYEISIESIESKYKEEANLYKLQIKTNNQEINDLRLKNEELELRLVHDVRGTKSRERELENRLELMKMEKISLLGSKDEIILTLKRKIDQLQYEVENFRKKTVDLQKNIDLNEDQIRRTVRALRLALTSLELTEEPKQNLKKASE